MGIVLAAGGVLSFLLALRGYLMYREGGRLGAAALPPSGTPAAKGDGYYLNAVAAAVGRPFTGYAVELLRRRRPGIRRRIDAAGRPGGMTVEDHARITAGYVVMFGPVALLMLAQGQVLLGLIFAVGATQNEVFLWTRTAQRREEIERALPDFLDVLAVTVAAGLSFRHSLARVSESMPGPLADEFTIALRQMDLGTPRRTAFEDLRRRNRSEMLGQFVTALLQAEELGAPLTSALMDIARDMRRAAAQWARRKAQRTTPRVTLVTTAMAVPAVILVVMGSVVLSSGTDFGAIFDR